MRLKNLLPRTLLVVSLVLVVAVILTTRSAFVSANDQIPKDSNPQTNQTAEQDSQINPNGSLQSDACPCIAKDACPRIYGQSALDIRELGIVMPCVEPGTVRCCGVTISVVQKSEDDAESSTGSVSGDEFEEEKVAEDVGVITEMSTENVKENKMTDAEGKIGVMEVTTNPGSEVVELSVFNLEDRNSSEISVPESDKKTDSEADLESAESVVMKTFETQSSKLRPMKMRRKKITASVSSVLSVDTDADSNSEESSIGESGGVGNENLELANNNPERVAVTAFAKDDASSRIASTTIILNSQSESTAEKKIHSNDLHSPIRKLMKETGQGAFSSSLSPTSSNDGGNGGVANGNANLSASGILPGKSFSTFGRQKFFSSHSQSGGTTSSSTTTGTSHSALSASIGNSKFRRPSSSSQSTSTDLAVDNGAEEKSDLINIPTETPHVSIIEQKDKLEPNERPMSLMIKPFIAGGRRKFTGGSSSFNSTSGTNSTSTSSNFMSTSSAFVRGSTNKTRNNFMSGQTAMSSTANANSQSFAKGKGSKQVGTNDAMKTEPQKPIAKGNSTGLLPTFKPKIRPFNVKKGNSNVGSGNVAVTVNKNEEDKLTTAEEIPATTQRKGNKGISLLHALKNGNKSSSLSVNKAGGKLEAQSAVISPLMHNALKTADSTSLLSSLSQAQTSQSLESLEKVVRKPGIRRRKTSTTTPTPVEPTDTEKGDENNGESAIPLFAHTKSSYKSTVAPVKINFADNRGKDALSYESPVLKVESLSTSQNVNSQSPPLYDVVEKKNLSAPAAPTPPPFRRGYRKRLRPLAQTHQALTQEEIMGEPMPLPSVTTEVPRVYSLPETEIQNGKYEKAKELDNGESSEETRPIGESSVYNRLSAGHHKSKFRQQLILTTSPPVLAVEITTEHYLPEEEDEESKEELIPKLDSDLTTEAIVTSGIYSNNLAELEPRRKVFGNRITPTTTGAPAYSLIKTDSPSEDESSVTLLTPSNKNNMKNPVRMTSTYSRIRVNNHNEESGAAATTFQHVNNQPNSNRRFRIPAALQIIRGSSTPATPDSKFVDLASSGRIPEESNRVVAGNEFKEFQSVANYGGESEGVEEENYDLILDKEARKSMYNQTSNSYPPSQSMYYQTESVGEQPTVTPTQNPNLKPRRRRPTTTPHPSEEAIVVNSEVKYLEGTAEKSGGDNDNEKKSGVTEIGSEATGEEVDIDLKVNIDANVDEDAEEEEDVDMDADKQEELESVGEQESRLHAKYVKRKFPILPSYNNRTHGNRISNENGKEDEKLSTAEMKKSSSEVDSGTDANASTDNLHISAATPVVSLSPRVRGKKIRKPQRGNSTRFAVDSIRSSSVKTGESFSSEAPAQVGHSHLPVAVEPNEVSPHAQLPDRFSSSSYSVSSAQALKGVENERVQIKTVDNSGASLADDNDKVADSVIGTHSNYRVVSSTPITSAESLKTTDTTSKFVFPPYRKSQSALIESSTTASPLPTRSRYNYRNRPVSTENSKSPASATPVNNVSKVESVVEFNSVPTRTAPTEPALATPSGPSNYADRLITNTNRNTNNVIGSVVSTHSNRNTNNAIVKEHQLNRFPVSQLSQTPVEETRMKMRKKQKTKVNAHKANDFSAPEILMPESVKPERVMTAIKTSTTDREMPPPTFTTFSIAQQIPSQLATTTEKDFLYQIPPTEAPYIYSPTSPVAPVTVAPTFYSIENNVPATTPAYVLPLTPSTSPPPPAIQFRNNYAAPSPLPTQTLPANIGPAVEFTRVNEQSEHNYSASKSKTSSRFPVPEKFDFSGWRATSSLTTPRTVLPPATVSQDIPRKENKYEINQVNFENPNIRAPAPQRIEETNIFNRHPIETKIQPAAPVNVPEQNNLPQPQIVQPQISTLDLSSVNAAHQNFYHANRITDTPTSLLQPAFDNINYHVTSNHQGFSIELADGKPPVGGKDGHSVSTSPFVPSQISYSTPSPLHYPQPTSPPQTYQQVQPLNTPTRSHYHGNNILSEGAEQDKRQNYVSQVPSPGPLSYTLPILPHHNPKMQQTVNIQYGEAVSVDTKEQNNLYSSNEMKTLPVHLSSGQKLSHGISSHSENLQPESYLSFPSQSASAADSWKSQSPPQSSQQFKGGYSGYSINSNAADYSQQLYSPPPQSLNVQQPQLNPNSDLKLFTNAPPAISISPNPSTQSGSYWGQSLSTPPIVLRESKLPSAYHYPSHATQNIVNSNGYNSYNNFQQPQQTKSNIYNSGSLQSKPISNPSVSVSFNSQGYNGNPVVTKPVGSPTLHAVPAQKQLPSDHLKEYHQHMQISQHIMNHMNRYNGRTSRARNITEDLVDTYLTAGSENQVAVASAPGDNGDVPLPSANILSNGTTNATYNSDVDVSAGDRDSKGLEAPADVLQVEGSERTVYEVLSPTSNDVTSALASQSEKSPDAIAEGRQAVTITLDNKSAVSVDENSKENSYGEEKPLRSSNSSELVDKQEFTPPKIIHGGFLPIVPYSEKDPGPILVKIAIKQEKATLESESNRNLLNHPNVIPQTNLQHNMHNQINKQYPNPAKFQNVKKGIS